MRALVALLLAGCGAAPLPPSVPSPPAVDTSWHLQGTARLVGSELRFNYCCVAWAAAEKQVDVAPGRWRMQLDHRNTDCRHAAQAFVFGADGLLLGDAHLDAGTIGAVADLDFEVDTPGASRLLISEVDGGLDCCGTTEVEAISLVRL